MENMLPSWVQQKGNQVFIDTDVAYPMYLDELGLEPSRYSVGAVYILVTRDLAKLCTSPGVIFVHKQSAKPGRWKYANLPGVEGDEDRGMRDAGRKFAAALMEKRARRAIGAT